MAEWGDSDGGLEPEGESGPSTINLGGGLVLHIDPVKFRRMLNSPKVRAAVNARGEAMAATANNLAVTRGAEYVYQPSRNPDNSRARGRVMPANYKAIVDSHHSTLLRALAAHPSDPKPDRDEVP